MKIAHKRAITHENKRKSLKRCTKTTSPCEATRQLAAWQLQKQQQQQHCQHETFELSQAPKIRKAQSRAAKREKRTEKKRKETESRKPKTVNEAPCKHSKAR